MNLNLIFDRTQDDVEHANALVLKMQNGETLTEEEQTEYMAGLKGRYNVADINRVNEAVRYVYSLLNSLGYITVVNAVDISQGDIVTDEYVQTYINNVTNLYNAFVHYDSTPLPPTMDDWIDLITANNIEKILTDLNDLAERILVSVRYSNTFYAGE